jgi:ABC-type nitrate/sulfonate/bicarbonate transport system ATPase subunit
MVFLGENSAVALRQTGEGTDGFDTIEDPLEPPPQRERDQFKIRMRNIRKSFPLGRKKILPVLRNVTFSVADGDFLVVLGKSGCGKSTLLHLMAGLTPLSGGEIRVDGVPVTGPDPSRALLFQQPTLLPWLTVAENIVFGCRIRNDRHRLEERAARLVQMMGLSGFERTRPHELSVGMAQRVCLARALIGQPDILLLDEPFAALDTFTRNHLQEQLIDLWRREKFTVVFVTHDINEAILMGQRILLLGGAPSRPVGVFDVNLHYPRDMGAKPFLLIRSEIRQRFRKVFLES